MNGPRLGGEIHGRDDRMNGEAKKSKEEILKLNKELSILNAISQTVNQSTDLDEILNKSVDKMMKMFDVHQASVYLLDEKNKELVFVVHRGFSKKFLEFMKHRKLGVGITGMVALSAEPIFVEDYPSHPEAVPIAIEEGVKSLAVIPLKSRDKIYGTLNIARKEASKITPFERESLQLDWTDHQRGFGEDFSLYGERQTSGGTEDALFDQSGDCLET